MKVIFANIMLNMFRGGGENYDLHISEQLALQGNNIDFYCLKPFTKKWAYDFPDYTNGKYGVKAPWLYPVTQKLYGKKGQWFWRCFRGLPRFIGQTYFEIATFLRLFKRRNEAFVLHACGLFLLSMLTRIFLKKKVFIRLPGLPTKRFHFIALRFVDGIVANGDVYRFLSQSHKKIAPLYQLNIGVNFSLFHEGKNKVILRKKLNLPVNKKIILFVGRMVAVKNISLLIESFYDVYQNDAEVALVLVGDGPLWDDVHEKIKALNLSSVIYCVGAVDKQSVANYYGAADLFALTSSYDNYPNAVIEAMASGLPVVATCVGGVNLQVFSGETGYLVPPNDKNKFAESLLSLLSNESLRKKMSTAAYLCAKSSFDWKKTADQFGRLIHEP